MRPREAAAPCHRWRVRRRPTASRRRIARLARRSAGACAARRTAPQPRAAGSATARSTAPAPGDNRATPTAQTVRAGTRAARADDRAEERFGIEAELRDELNDLDRESERDDHRQLLEEIRRVRAAHRAAYGSGDQQEQTGEQEEVRRAQEQVELMLEPVDEMPEEVERAAGEQRGDADDAVRIAGRNRLPERAGCAIVFERSTRTGRARRKWRRCTSSCATG